MARIMAQKAPTTGAPIGGLRRADFKGGDDFELHGYWMHPTRRANVEVPIFQHEFYPTLAHTDLDVQQNISYRTVIVPSIADLHQAGIHADKAIFVAETWTHPRYIKHRNYFRSDFPANVKTLARQQDIVFVFAANDLPFARLKRKKVLNYYRAAFSPLYIKGSHYTSGRMQFFFVAPPHVAAPLRKSLNLEDINENWEDAVAAVKHKHMGQSRVSESRLRQMLEQQIQKEMQEVVLPVVTSQLHVSPNSAEGQEIAQLLQDPKLVRNFMDSTYHKPSRFTAVKGWVNQRFWPQLKYIVSSETGQALESGARYVVRLAISVAFDQVLGKLKNLPDPTPGSSARRPSPWRSSVRNVASKFDYNIATGYGGSQQVGLGSLSYGTSHHKPMDIERYKTRIKHFILDVYNEMSQDALPLIGLDFFKVTITPQGHVDISWDDYAIKKQRDHLDQTGIRVNLGRFDNPSWQQHAQFYLPRLSKEATNYYHDMTTAGY